MVRASKNRLVRVQDERRAAPSTTAAADGGRTVPPLDFEGRTSADIRRAGDAWRMGDAHPGNAWVQRPPSLGVAAAICLVGAGAVTLGALWVSGYALEPEDGISRSGAIVATAVYGASALLLAALGVSLALARPRAWPVAHTLAWTATVAGCLWVGLSVLVMLVIMIGELLAPRLADAVLDLGLWPDFTTAPLLALAGFLALRSLRRPDTRRWFGVAPTPLGPSRGS